MFVKPCIHMSVRICLCETTHTHPHTHTHAVAIEWAQVDMRSTIATIKIDICIKPNTHTDSHTHSHTHIRFVGRTLLTIELARK